MAGNKTRSTAIQETNGGVKKELMLLRLNFIRGNIKNGNQVRVCSLTASRSMTYAQ